MTDRLPPNLLALFQPRPPLRYLPPNDHAPEERTTTAIEGVAGFVQALKEKKEADKDLPYTESDLERRDRIKLEKQEHQEWLSEEGFKTLYKPREDPNILQEDQAQFRTLFLGRLPYSCTKSDLEKEFAEFGPIQHIRLVTVRNSGKAEKDGKPKGYGFLVFRNERDCKEAYKRTEHLWIRNRKVLVDIERGRTTSNWRPRRLGGGLGGRNYTKAPPKPVGGFAPPPFGGRGGFRGGFGDRGGGFRGGRGGGGFRGGGGGYGGRGGIGYQNGGGPGVDGAPAGPRSGFGGGGRDDFRRRDNNANYEPLPPRGGGGYRDRDRERDFSGGSQKRPYEGGGYDDRPQRRPRQF